MERLITLTPAGEMAQRLGVSPAFWGDPSSLPAFVSLVLGLEACTTTTCLDMSLLKILNKVASDGQACVTKHTCHRRTQEGRQEDWPGSGLSLGRAQGSFRVRGQPKLHGKALFQKVQNRAGKVASWWAAHTQVSSPVPQSCCTPVPLAPGRRRQEALKFIKCPSATQLA